jgi:hypothetical protein
MFLFLLGVNESSMTTYDQDIRYAINNWRQIEFTYHDKYRKGNPQCYGLSKKGKPALRVHLSEGGDRPEQLFTLDKVSNLKVLPTKFKSPGPNYKKGDSDMTEIFSDLE